VYYGDEIGLTGGHDPGCRRGFNWDRSAWNENLRAYVKSCIDLRRSHPVLRIGTFLSLYAQDGVYVFARLLAREVAVVALNASKEFRSITVELPAGLVEVSALRGVWTGEPVPIAAGRIDDLQLGPRSGDVLIGSRNATT
jgi:neopullulanase